jgi:capsular polysaccharide biosynthesis protein
MPVELVDLGEMSPAEQLQAISRTRVLVGQHGAGLVHSLFMIDDGPIVEMRLAESQDHFQNLSEGLGRDYRAFYLDEDHATLSQQLINDIANEVLLRT